MENKIMLKQVFKLGTTQDEIAEMVGISRQSINGYLNNPINTKPIGTILEMAMIGGQLTIEQLGKLRIEEIVYFLPE